MEEQISLYNKLYELIPNYLRDLFSDYINPEDITVDKNNNKISVDTSVTNFKEVLEEAGWKVEKFYVDSTHSFYVDVKGFPLIECSRIYDPEEDEEDEDYKEEV